MHQRKRINTHLKSLAEARSRALARVEYLDRSLPSTEREIAELTARLAELASHKLHIEIALEAAKNEIEMVDKALAEDFPQVNPLEIVPTYEFRPEYGKRGALTACIRQVLHEAGHPGLTSMEVGVAVSKILGIDHTSEKEFNRWMRNTLRNRLQRMRNQSKEVEELRVRGQKSRWRLSLRKLSWDGMFTDVCSDASP